MRRVSTFKFALLHIDNCQAQMQHQKVQNAKMMFINSQTEIDDY